MTIMRTSCCWPGASDVIARLLTTSPVALSAGLSTARFTGPDVRWLALPAGTVVREIRAHDASVVDDDGWRELEIVGLPEEYKR